MPTTTTIELIVGIALLVLGRKLFWLFVGAVGFLAGFHFAPMFLHGQSESVILTISILCGVAGIILAIFIQKVAVGIAGFLGGGYLAMNLAGSLGMTWAENSWVLFIVGGIIGALLLSLLFGWALIALSSLVGAVLIVQAIHMPQASATIVIVVLCIAGIVIQSKLLRGGSSPERA